MGSRKQELHNAAVSSDSTKRARISTVPLIFVDT